MVSRTSRPYGDGGTIGRGVRVTWLRLSVRWFSAHPVRTVVVLGWLVLVACGSGAGEVGIVYIGWDGAGVTQLFVVDGDGENQRQLTTSDYGIFDFAVAPAGGSLVYAQLRADAGSDLWLIEDEEARLVLACPDQQCVGAVWAHDGGRVVYERRTLTGAEPRLWWLDVRSGESVPVFSDEALLGYAAAFSTDDRYLSFVQFLPPDDSLLPPGHSFGDGHNHGADFASQPTQQVTVFDFESGRQLAVPNFMNSRGVWRPGAEEVLLLDMQFLGPSFSAHILHVDVMTDAVTDISQALTVEDASPAWRGDGEWVVFGRKRSQAPMGFQLWLMRSDGSEARQLTDDANIHHGQPSFSVDGETILFQRFDITNPASDPSIWLYVVATGEMQEIVGAGSRPQWVER